MAQVRNNGNGEIPVNFQRQNGLLANSTKSARPLTGFVQIVTEPRIEPVEAELSQNCVTVLEHANFLQDMINQNRGKKLGLHLNSPVSLITIFKDKVVLADYDVRMEPGAKYTFHYELKTIKETKANEIDEELEKPEKLEHSAKENTNVGEHSGKSTEEKLAEFLQKLVQLRESLSQSELEVQEVNPAAGDDPAKRKVNFWDRNACGKELAISHNGFNAEIEVDAEIRELPPLMAKFAVMTKHGTVRAKFPLQKCQEGLNYFEVKIVKQIILICVGLVTRDYPMDISMSERGSYCLVSSGNCYVSDQCKKFGEGFDDKDRVGCGLTQNGQIFFTLNGKLMRGNFSLPKVNPNVELFPAVSLTGMGSEIEAFFGEDQPFVFDLHMLPAGDIPAQSSCTLL